MAAYLNRTISMVTGNGSSSTNSNGGSSSYDANALTDRQLHNAATDNSPLQIFVKAKKRINDIFGEIEEYVLETDRFIDSEFCTAAELLNIFVKHNFHHIKVTRMKRRSSTRPKHRSSRVTFTKSQESARCWLAIT